MMLAALLAMTTVLPQTVVTTNVKAATSITDSALSDKSTAEPEAWGVTPDANQYKYQKDELAAFVHFGMNTFTGSEWGNGRENPSNFNLTNPFDAETLVKAIYDAGFKKVIVTAKHHDGFCIWRSAYTDHDLEATNYEGDVLAEISAACTKYNLDMGLYLSPWDVNAKSYGYFKEDGSSLIGSNGYPINGMTWEQADELDYLDYNEYYNNQLIEILSDERYGNGGRFVEVWMDGAKGGGSAVQWYDFEKWFDTIQQYEGKAAGFDADSMLFGAKAYTTVRWIGNENGFAADETWSKSIVDYDAKEMIDYNGSRIESLDNGGTVESNSSDGYTKGYENGNQWTIGESDARITSGWFWGNGKKTPKSMEQLSEMYFRSVGHNSPLLLNIPPNNQGKVDQDILNRLAEFGLAIQNTFDENLAEGATISVDSVYGNDIAFKPSNMIDGDDATYWATAEGTNTAEMIIDLGETKSFDIVSIEEAIQKGQRIKSFTVEVSNNGGEWKQVATGATIGAKRLARFKEVKADKVRITMETTDSEILISEVGVFKATRDFEMPNPIPDGLTVVDNTDKDTSDGAGFSYSGWTQETGAQYVNETNMYANPNAELTLTFSGNQVFLVGTKDPNHGTMEVFIDGVSQGIIDTSATTRSVGQMIYASDVLADGQHTLKLVVKNKAIGIEAAAILDNGGKGMFELEYANYEMPEESEMDVTIKRVGGSNGAVSVLLQDNPGTAVQGDYYTTEGIKVDFADGETSKTVTIRTKRDTKVKGDIFFTIELVEPTGGAIVGFTSEAVVTIKDLDGFTKEQLQELYDTVTGYIEGTYNEGWEAFATAKAFAATVLAEEDAVNYGKAYLQLKAAKEGLVPLGSFTEANPYLFPVELGTTNTLEAEYAALENTGGADEQWKLNVSTGDWASNGKFVNCLNQNDIMRIPYKAETAGTYEVTVTYRSGDPNNKLSFTDTAGNIVAQDVVAGASSPSETKTVKFTLVIENAGTGTWTFTGPSSKSPMLDKFDIKLVSVTVSTNALEAAIAKAESLTAHLYTEDSYAALTAKLDAAKALLADENKTQASVNAAVTEIENAINALVGKPLNDANLINKSANSGVTIEAVDSEYTGETADKTLDYNNSTHWHSDWSGSDKLPISITYDLGASYELADIAFLSRQDGSWNGDIFEFDLYVGDDANNLTLVKHVVMNTTGSGANEVLANRNAFQRVMFEATGRYVKMTVTRSGCDDGRTNMFTSMAEIRFYEKAEEIVVPEVDKTALEKAINDAEKYEASAYTPESFAALTNAIDKAIDLYGSENLTQEQADAMVAELTAAIAGLVEKPVAPAVDKSALDAAITLAAEKLENEDAYTEESVAELQAAAFAAMTVVANPEATQEEVDAAVEAINAAITGLVEKPTPTAPAKVENVKAADTDYKTITLTWDASEGATAYEVYRKAYDSEEFKLYKTVEDTTVAVTGVMTGKEYAFYVVAKNEVGAADASESVAQATTLHGKVTLAIEKVSTAKFKLSWNAIDGATRYIVYRKRNDDKMKKVLTLGSKDLEYTTAEMPHGDYQFILKAGRYDSKDRVMTGSSNTVKGSVEELAPTVKLTAGSKSVKVAWSKMEGVTHYQVYRATSSTGKYTKLITTTSTSYTSKSLSKGKKYFFKVRGYKTYKSGDDLKYTVYTPYSTVKSATAK